MEALTDELAYEQGFSITLNEEKDPLFYRFDYDVCKCQGVFSMLG